MTQIVKQNNALSPFLTKEEIVIIKSQDGKRVSQCSDAEIANALNNAIYMAHKERKETPLEKDITTDIVILLPDIKTYFSTMFINEIALFFKSGADGLYNNNDNGYNPLCVSSYRNWLRRGISDSKRSQAMKLQQQYLRQLSQPPELKDEEKEALVKKGVIEAFEIIKSGKEYIGAVNVYYNYLDKYKLIPYSVARKKEFMKLAEQSLRTGLVNELVATGKPAEKQSIKATLDTLKTNHIDRIKDEARRIALITFFKELIEVGENIETIINEKK